MGFPITYGGQSLFGYAQHCTMIPNANAQQIAEFFGVNGYQSLYGGLRGRIFQIQGLMPGSTPAGVIQNEQLLLSLADGRTRTLVDTTGIPWANVILTNEYQPVGKFMQNCSYGGWIRGFRVLAHGLT